jgi:formylglycine-generating enzyme required for sulfatase activity
MMYAGSLVYDVIGNVWEWSRVLKGGSDFDAPCGKFNQEIRRSGDQKKSFSLSSWSPGLL